MRSYFCLVVLRKIRAKKLQRMCDTFEPSAIRFPQNGRPCVFHSTIRIQLDFVIKANCPHVGLGPEGSVRRGNFCKEF